MKLKREEKPSFFNSKNMTYKTETLIKLFFLKSVKTFLNSEFTWNVYIIGLNKIKWTHDM